MGKEENLCQSREYTMDMIKDVYKEEIARALRTSTILDILGDDYDLDRLRELLEADREGRVKILPKSEENTCGSCGHFQRAPGLNSGTCDVQSRYKNKWGQEDVKRGLFTPYQSRRACKKYVWKGVDQHGQDL